MNGRANGSGPRLVVVAATRLEARAAERALPGVVVWRCGVGFRRPPPPGTRNALLVSLGLCGSLVPTVTPGTVMIPREVGRPGVRDRLRCDAELSLRLAAAARALGHTVSEAPMLTSDQLVAGPERARWAQRGYAAVDMETGFLGILSQHVVAVRVVLDGPGHELPAALADGLAALLHPTALAAGLRVAAPARRGAAAAARITAGALVTAGR